MNLTEYHSYAYRGDIITKHLNWQAEVDFEQKKIHATAEWKFDAVTTESILFLDTYGLEIQSITDPINMQALVYELSAQDSLLGQALKIKVPIGCSGVKINYSTSSEAAALQWMNTKPNENFLFSQSQAILARTWLPVQDAPSIRFTYEAKVKVPEGMLALMSAENNPKEIKGDSIYHFSMSKPIPAYLMSLAVGNLKYDSIGQNTGVYALPDMIEKAAFELADMQAMLDTAEQLFETYAWGRFDVLMMPASFPFGGMENPCITYASPSILVGDRSLVSLIAHELAHSWSGNLVTNATWEDFWINEGFTVYVEMRLMEALYGQDYADMLIQNATHELQEEVQYMLSNNQSADTWLKLNLEGRDPDEGVTNIAYDKGYLFLRSIEEKIGRERWDNFMQQHFQRYAFRSIGTEQLLLDFSHYLFHNSDAEWLKAYFNSWVYAPGLPLDFPQTVSTRFQKVDEAVRDFSNGANLSGMDSTWSTHEYIRFIHQLPANLSLQQMKQLDSYFGFSQSANAEIFSPWALKIIHNNYTEQYPALERFLISQGRRKFILPIYEKLAEKPEGRTRAIAIYQKAKQNYHAVSRKSISAALKIEI